jgi:hypothetical protein
MSAGGKVLEGLTATSDADLAWATQVAEFQANIRQRMVSSGDMTPLDILPLAHEFAHTPVGDPANLLWTWQITAHAAHNRVRVILSAEHGNHSIGYAGDLCDAPFVRLRRIASAARETWDRVRCLDLKGGTTTAPTDATASVTREEFARALLTPRASTRVDFMTRFGVEWLDPTTDRKLLERLLTFPLHIFRVGNRPQGLARELGRGRLPETVRLRRARAAHMPEQTIWFVQRAADYRRAVQRLRDSGVCMEFLDLPSLTSLLETLCAGNGTTTQAAALHRALDAGLFAAGFESGHGRGAVPTPPLFESVADRRRISAAR